MLVDRRFGKRFVRFPDANAVGNAAGAFEQNRTDFLEQILCHVFCSRVVRHDEQSTRLNHLQSADRVFVLVADEEAMVPVLVEPAFAFGFEVGKIHNPSDGILCISGYEEICHVVVTVKMFALAAVLEQAMPGAEFNPAHDCKTHFYFFPCGRTIYCCSLGLSR